MSSELTITLDQDDLVNAIKGLTAAVKYQGDSIGTLMDAANAEAEAILPTKRPLHGFAEGESVALIAGHTVRRGTVDSTAYNSINWERNVPVRLANGSGDAWQARYLVRIDETTKPLLALIDPPIEFGDGPPPPGTNRAEWNRAALILGRDQARAVTFTYQKNADDWAFEYQRPAKRHILPLKFEETANDPARQVVHGTDLDVPESVPNRYKTFRLDRITDYVRLDEKTN